MGKIRTSEVIVRVPPSVAADIGNKEITYENTFD